MDINHGSIAPEWLLALTLGGGSRGRGHCTMRSSVVGYVCRFSGSSDDLFLQFQ